jgi:hypothetical protein
MSVHGDNVDVTVKRDSTGSIIVRGQITKFAGEKQQIYWISPQKPTRGIGFNGSGMPFANAEIAFENTKNRGYIDSPDGTFTIKMDSLPNGYYSGLGSTYIPPIIMLETTSAAGKFRTHIFLSPVSVPYRWISGAPPGSQTASTKDDVGRAMFYNGRESLPLFKNQEAILRAKGYPCDDANFGLPDVDAAPWKNVPSPA